MFSTLLMVIACNPPGEELGLAVDAAPTIELMAPTRLLTRASIDLLGVRPSVADLERIEAHPEDIESLLEDFLYDDRFGDRVAAMFAEIYRTNSEIVFVDLEAWEKEYTWKTMTSSIGREPLEMLAWVTNNDLPYTELVTADYTMGDELLAYMWELDYPEGETGWHKSYYTDGRPMAGVLSGNGLWWYYGSTDSNMNRGRANHLSRIFLCYNYLKKPVDFDRNLILVDDDAVADAINHNPGCSSCHATLDPLASHYFGFYWNDVFRPVEIVYYHADRERMWETTNGRHPGFFGATSYGMVDLGHKVAADPRYPQCMVERSFELMLRRDITVQDTNELTAHREIFLENDLTVRSLFRSIIGSDSYRVGVGYDDTDITHKMITPDLLSSTIRDLTDFELTEDGFDLLLGEEEGYLTIAGGADGYTVTRTAREPGATVLLVQERVAESAAEYVLANDMAAAETGTARKLFEAIDFTEVDFDGDDRDVMVQQIQDLHWRILGNRIAADGPEVEANIQLWKDIYDVDPQISVAWAAVVTVLLRDPDFIFY